MYNCYHNLRLSQPNDHRSLWQQRNGNSCSLLLQRKHHKNCYQDVIRTSEQQSVWRMLLAEINPQVFTSSSFPDVHITMKIVVEDKKNKLPRTRTHQNLQESRWRRGSTWTGTCLPKASFRAGEYPHLYSWNSGTQARGQQPCKANEQTSLQQQTLYFFTQQTSFCKLADI